MMDNLKQIILTRIIHEFYRVFLPKRVKSNIVVAMRALALIAFFALQLSVFTCGFDIHVHAMNSNVSHIAEHSHDKGGKHNPDSANHGCHVHASHTFAASGVMHHAKAPPAFTEHCYILADLNLKNLPFLIEHPPKLLHS